MDDGTKAAPHGVTLPKVACHEAAWHEAAWRGDIDALAFATDSKGFCMVHRRAFGTLLKSAATPADCLAYFRRHEGAFRAAASAKIVRAGLAPGTNLHLTSRDVARELRK
jgi:hypothetical protein